MLHIDLVRAIAGERDIQLVNHSFRLPAQQCINTSNSNQLERLYTITMIDLAWQQLEVQSYTSVLE